MNKAELVAALEGRLGSKKIAAEALEAVVDTIQRAVSRGEKVAISGFGSFEKTVRGARVGRNPRTGEKVKIKKTSVPRFKPGTAFKSYVSDPKTLPKAATGTAAAPAARTTRAAAGATKAPARAVATKTAVKAPARAATKTAVKAPAKAAPARAAATKTATKAAPARAAATKTATKAAPAKTAVKSAVKAPARAAATKTAVKAPAKTAVRRTPAKKA